MDYTLDQWLSLMCRRFDFEAPRINRLRSYTNGNAPMPEMGPNLRESWIKFQRRSRINMGNLIVDALTARIIPKGVTVDGSSTSEVARQVERIWRDNRLDVAVPDAVADSFTSGRGFLLVTAGDDGRAVVTREAPETFLADPDPVRPWRARSALKMWRDGDAGQDFADLDVPGMVARFTRGSYTSKVDAHRPITTAVGGWKIGGITPFQGDVPVVILENRNGLGEFETATDSIVRINWGILERLVTTAMQAFRQRAMKVSDVEGSAGIPEVDDDGNRIDYAEIFSPGPGALWELPPGVEIWESQQADLNPMLLAVRDDMKFLSAETQTPVSMLVPDGANQSAAGAEFAREGLTNKATDRIRRFRPALSVMLVKALAVEGVHDPATIEVAFEPPAMVSLSEKYEAAAAARQVGEALETVQRNILGYSPQQVAEDKALRAQATLELAAMSANQPPVGQAQAATATPEPDGEKVKAESDVPAQ